VQQQHQTPTDWIWFDGYETRKARCEHSGFLGQTGSPARETGLTLWSRYRATTDKQPHVPLSNMRKRVVLRNGNSRITERR